MARNLDPKCRPVSPRRGKAVPEGRSALLTSARSNVARMRPVSMVRSPASVCPAMAFSSVKTENSSSLRHPRASVPQGRGSRPAQRARRVRTCCSCSKAASMPLRIVWASGSSCRGAPDRAAQRCIGQWSARGTSLPHPVLVMWLRLVERVRGHLRVKAALEAAESRGFPNGSKWMPRPARVPSRPTRNARNSPATSTKVWLWNSTRVNSRDHESNTDPRECRCKAMLC